MADVNAHRLHPALMVSPRMSEDDWPRVSVDAQFYVRCEACGIVKESDPNCGRSSGGGTLVGPTRTTNGLMLRQSDRGRLVRHSSSRLGTGSNHPYPALPTSLAHSPSRLRLRHSG